MSANICVSYSIDIWYEVACKISVNIPVWVYPSLCKAWIAWSTLFATNFTSELSRVFMLNACSTLSSKYYKIKDGGFLVSSSTWRIHGQVRKYFKRFRSVSRRPSGAVLMITFPAWELLFLAVIRLVKVELGEVDLTWQSKCLSRLARRLNNFRLFLRAVGQFWY